jgi:D-aminopeptidase
LGTASRIVSAHTIGVLVQANFGGTLTIAGVPIGRELAPSKPSRASGDGSCMMVVATDAPLDSRNLERLAARAIAGMARTGSSFSNGSGDYAIAFSTATELRIPHGRGPAVGGPALANDAVSPLFRAAIEATEEAIVNALFRATDVTSRFGSAKAIPVDEVARLVRSKP